MITRTFSLILTTINCATASKEIIQNGGFEDGTCGWGSMGITFLAPTGAQETLMFVRSYVSHLSRAVNLHLTRSEINQCTQGAIIEHSEN